MTGSPAYQKAFSLRQQLAARYDEATRQLVEAGRGDVLRSFVAILGRGADYAGINLSFESLVRFLDKGSYLNIYEFVAEDKGHSGHELDREVMKRLGALGPLRLTIDRLFAFQQDTHYASFNLGGAGAGRYGPCCVVLDLRHWAPFHTCYAGDSIRACFSPDGSQVLSDEEILSGFAVGEDAVQLAVTRHMESLLDKRFCVSPVWARNLLEAQDSLLEIHLHGPVRREHVWEVRMSPGEYEHLQDLSRRYDTSPRHHYLFEFQRVPGFRDALKALDRHGVPLVLGEGRGD